MSDEPRSAAPPESPADTTFGSERAKAFIDAVVAIALTLLILPLLDDITSTSALDPGGAWDAASWLDANFALLTSFLISFVVIGMFWMGHHRTFARVRRVTTGLLWLSLAWLVTIVWLPVATAMTDEASDDDALAKVLYIGAMALTSLIELGQLAYLRRHPVLHDIEGVALRRRMSVALAMAVLFLASLLVATLVPDIGYFALFLLLLTNPVRLVLGRLLGVPRMATGRRRTARDD